MCLRESTKRKVRQNKTGRKGDEEVKRGGGQILALAFHISGTALMNRLLAMSSSSDDITTKPFKAFTRSLRLCEITVNNLLYLREREREKMSNHGKQLQQSQERQRIEGERKIENNGENQRNQG